MSCSTKNILDGNTKYVKMKVMPTATLAETPPKTARIDVIGHPLKARDPIEARTFTRDLLIADFFGLESGKKSVWLATRAKCRRDLLWFCRNLLGLDRLTEEIHRKAADFVVSIITSPKYGFGNYRDPRGNGKTSLSTRGGSLWCVIQDPQECIERGWPIIGRESRLGINTLKSEITAAFMQMLLDDLSLSDFQAIFPELTPEIPKRWGQKGIDLRRGLLPGLESHPLFAGYPRMTRFLDPTFAPGSLESGRAGAHTHGEFVDDPVNEKTWNSALNIANAIHGIKQLFSIVRPERGFRLVTGNDWCPDDVNSQMDELGGWRVFMRSATACRGCVDGYPVDSNGLVPKDPGGRPSHKHDGQTFVNLMRESDGKTPDLGVIKTQCQSIHIYLAQYENDPISPEATCWSSERMPRYEVIEFKGSRELDLNTLVKFPWPGAPSGVPEAERFQVSRVSHMFRTLAFDPSSGGLGRDASEAAITVLARTSADNFCWLSALARQDDPLTMLNALVEEVIFWKVQRIAIESVAYARIIKPLLEREFETRKVNWLSWDEDIVPVVTSRADGDKELRIRSALNPLINSRALLISTHMRGYGAAMLQLDGFPIRKPWDTLDSLTFHSHLWDRVPMSLAKQNSIRLKELLERRKRRRGMGVSYGWGTPRSGR